MAYKPGDRVHKSVLQKMDLSPERTYVVDFFASWCQSCRHELPLVEKVHRKLAAKDTEVIGVDVDKHIENGKTFQKELALTFRVIDDPKGEIIRAFDPIGMPAIYIVRKGKVERMMIGAKDDIDILIEKAVGEAK